MISMVPNDEMKIMIEIQLLTLVACGINITQLRPDLQQI
jgi:hypothetical protein